MLLPSPLWAVKSTTRLSLSSSAFLFTVSEETCGAREPGLYSTWWKIWNRLSTKHTGCIFWPLIKLDRWGPDYSCIIVSKLFYSSPLFFFLLCTTDLSCWMLLFCGYRAVHTGDCAQVAIPMIARLGFHRPLAKKDRETEPFALYYILHPDEPRRLSTYLEKRFIVTVPEEAMLIPTNAL